MNMALLSKWVWYLGDENNSLWKKIIVQKYGIDETGLYTTQRLPTHGYALW